MNGTPRISPTLGKKTAENTSVSPALFLLLLLLLQYCCYYYIIISTSLSSSGVIIVIISLNTVPPTAPWGERTFVAKKTNKIDPHTNRIARMYVPYTCPQSARVCLQPRCYTCTHCINHAALYTLTCWIFCLLFL